MKALVLRDFGDLAVQDRPDPERGEGEVLLRVIATGICGSDLHGYTGENGRRRPGQVMGHETVGRVVEAGVDGPAPGTLATVNPVLACGRCAACDAGREQACPTKSVIGVDPTLTSAFAEYLAVPTGNVVPLPDGMPPDHGALVEPLAVASHALRRGDARDGDRVVVIGGGPIGQSVVLACLQRDVTQVVVSEPDPARRDLCRTLGVEAVAPDDLTVDDATLAVDAVGTSSSIAAALAATEPGGRVVLVGMHTPEPTIPAYAVSTAERTIIGSFCYSAEDFRATAAWAAATDLSVLIENRVPLADAPTAFAEQVNGRLAAGKVLVTFGER